MDKISRREFLALALSGSAAVGACACGGMGLTTYLLLSQREDRHSESSVLPTPQEQSLPTAADFNIVPRESWGALEPNHDAFYEKGFTSDNTQEGWLIYAGDLREIYTTVVIHHSVVDEGDDLRTLQEIQRLHRRDRQWADVGYHYLIGKTGVIYAGRPIGVRGVHVAGHNWGSAGVCLLGNFMEQLPAPEQMQAADTLVQWLTTNLELTYLGAHRHYNSNTVCPGDNVLPYLAEMANNAGLIFYPDLETPTPDGTSACGCFL